MDVEQIVANKQGWFTPQEAAAYYGRGRTLEEIVLHHWDTPDKRPGFQGNLNYLTNPPGGVPTANCVIGWDEAAGRIRIVDSVPYPDVAFTSSGPNLASLKNLRAKYINCVSVGIELDPLVETSGPHRAEIIRAAGYRIWQYRRLAGQTLPLTRHSDYVFTECPGNVPADEIELSAQAWAAGIYTGNDMIPDQAHLDAVFQRFFGRNSTSTEQAEWINKKGYTQLIDTLESQQAYRDQVTYTTTGFIAVRDNWQKQIGDLQAQVKALGNPRILQSGIYRVM